MASALEYAHSRGVVHRDMKPANIMIDTDGRAIVTDFGIAKAGQGKGLTMTGAAIGTPYYMSPEQCAAKKELTGASDQYSLGIVAHEMLTGKVPFNADSPLSIMYAHFHEAPPPVTEGRPDCPPEIQTALQRMLAKDPAERWPDVESAVTALGAVPLARTDPVLAQLKTLARSGVNAALAQTVRTPASPVPGSLAASVRAAEGAGAHGAAAADDAADARVAGQESRSRGMLWAVPVIALAAVGGWWIATRSTARKVGAAARGRRSPSGTRSATSTGAGGGGEARHGAGARAGAERPRHAARHRRRAPAPPPAAPPPPPAVTEAQFRAMGIQALSRRAKATAVGATMADLRGGDVEAVQAEVLGKQGKYTEAAAHLDERDAGVDGGGRRSRPARRAPRPRRTGARSGARRRRRTPMPTSRSRSPRTRRRSRRAISRTSGARTPDSRRSRRRPSAPSSSGRRTCACGSPWRTSCAPGDRADVMISGSYEYLDLESGRLEQQAVSQRAGLLKAFGSLEAALDPVVARRAGRPADWCARCARSSFARQSPLEAGQ